MHKRNIWIVLMCIFALTLIGCGNKPADKQIEMSTEIESSGDEVESNKEDDTEQENSDNSDNTIEQENESTSSTQKPDIGNNSNTTTGSNNTTTTKPSTGSSNSGSTGSSGSTGNTSNNTGATTPSKPAHTHSWTEVKETVVVQEAWVEDVYGWRTICGKCGLDMTEMNGEDLVAHSALICKSRYSNKYIKIDEIQHPAVTELQVTGYKCSCGETKEK